jgi:broad specificity phosphatase PhoE
VSPRKRTVETAAVMKASGVVLVVGHSNTIAAIVNALAGTTLPDLCDASYATLFVVTPARDGGTAQVVKSMYGTPDTVGAAQCAGMVPK